MFKLGHRYLRHAIGRSCRKVSFRLSFNMKRMACFAASTVLFSFVTTGADAQTIDVLTGLSSSGAYSSMNGPSESSYTFTQSMILNSIGFVSGGRPLTDVSYSLNGVGYSVPLGNLTGADSNGIRWYHLGSSAITVSANTTLSVFTQGQMFTDEFVGTYYNNYEVHVGSTNPDSKVTYNGLMDSNSHFVTSWSNSNLRVSASNPGSNVAPEPGSFALALTGGAALLGICIRRRRNAG